MPSHRASRTLRTLAATLSAASLLSACGLEAGENPDQAISYKGGVKDPTVTGVGVGTPTSGPVLKVTPSSAALKSGSKQTIEVQSAGTEAVQLSASLYSITGTDAATFTVIGNLCPLNGVLPAGQSCRLTVTYVRPPNTPSTTIHTADLNVFSDNAGSDSVALSGSR